MDDNPAKIPLKSSPKDEFRFHFSELLKCDDRNKGEDLKKSKAIASFHLDKYEEYFVFYVFRACV